MKIIKIYQVNKLRQFESFNLKPVFATRCKVNIILLPMCNNHV